MPGRDRTGPNGRGPITGWGLGFCGSNTPRMPGEPRNLVPPYSPPRMGRGFRRGNGGGHYGPGRGYGRGFRYFEGYGNTPQASNLTPEEEAAYYEQYIQDLEAAAAEAKTRLEKAKNVKDKANG